MSTLEATKSEFRYKQLQDYDTEVNWQNLVKFIAHHYVESRIGNLVVPVESMIRIYFLQLRYNLSASEAAIALSKIDVLRDFALIDLNTDVLPEEKSINAFYNLIKEKSLVKVVNNAFKIEPILK